MGRGVGTQRPSGLAAGLARLLALLLLAGAAHAQAPAPLAQPNLALFAGGIVYAVLRLPDGGVVIGGLFSSIHDPVSGLDIQRDNLAKFDANGGLDLQWNPATDGIVRALGLDADGRVLVGGDFQHVDGTARSRIARVQAAGSGNLDPDWNPGANTGGVLAFALDSQGRVYVGGGFTQCGGLSRTKIARLLADGSADPAWDAALSGFNQAVYALAMDGADRLYVGGVYQNIGGQARTNLARLLPGTPVLADPDWSAATSSTVFALALDGAALYVGGQFGSIGGLTRNGLARVDTGTLAVVDATWKPSPQLGNVYAIALAPDGTVVVGGLFTTIGGQAHARLAKLSKLDAGAAIADWTPDADADVYALATQPGGEVLAGGLFTRVGGESRAGFARVDGAGSVLAAPAAQSGGRAAAVLRAPDGRVYVGGAFVRANGVPRDNLLRLAPDGTLDPDWHPDANASVSALALDAGGALYVGGDFTRIGDQARACLARVPQGPSGTVDASWNPAITALFACNVRALAVDGVDRLYVGGSFSGIGGLTRNYLARLAPGATVVVDPDWNPAPDFIVHAFAFDGAGSVYLGGQFSNLGALPRGMVAKLATEGAGLVDGNWNPAANGGFLESVYALALDGSGSLFVGGEFDTIGGQPRQRLAKLSATGTGAADADWIADANGTVRTVLLDGAGALFAGGDFSAIGANPRSALAKLSTAGVGEIDAVWNPAPNGLVLGLDRAPDGRLYAAGSFVAIGGQGRRLVAAVPPVVESVFADGFESP